MRIQETMGAIQCTKVARATGLQCKRTAVRGATVCRAHGGALPVVKAKAQERIAIWEAMQYGEHRHPAVVLEDVLHGFDVLAHDARVALEETHDMTPEAMDRFISYNERAGKFAKVMLDSRATDMLARRASLDGEVIVGVLNRALGSVSMSFDVEAALRQALARELLAIEAAQRATKTPWQPLPLGASVGEGDGRDALEGEIVGEN